MASYTPLVDVRAHAAACTACGATAVRVDVAAGCATCRACGVVASTHLRCGFMNLASRVTQYVPPVATVSRHDPAAVHSYAAKCRVFGTRLHLPDSVQRLALALLRQWRTSPTAPRPATSNHHATGVVAALMVASLRPPCTPVPVAVAKRVCPEGNEHGRRALFRYMGQLVTALRGDGYPMPVRRWAAYVPRWAAYMASVAPTWWSTERDVLVRRDLVRVLDRDVDVFEPADDASVTWRPKQAAGALLFLVATAWRPDDARTPALWQALRHVASVANVRKVLRVWCGDGAVRHRLVDVMAQRVTTFQRTVWERHVTHWLVGRPPGGPSKGTKRRRAGKSVRKTEPTSVGTGTLVNGPASSPGPTDGPVQRKPTPLGPPYRTPSPPLHGTPPTPVTLPIAWETSTTTTTTTVPTCPTPHGPTKTTRGERTVRSLLDPTTVGIGATSWRR